MRPICAPCKIHYRCKKNGLPFVINSGGEPYQLWMGDLWECQNCHAQIISGVGAKPIAEHHEEGFASKIEIYRVHDSADGVMLYVEG